MPQNKENVYAQFELGQMYRIAEFVPKNYEAAAKRYRLAAEEIDVNAQYILGGMYKFGFGVTKNEKSALKWYRLAADQAYADALTMPIRLFAEFGPRFIVCQQRPLGLPWSAYLPRPR